MMVIYCFRLQKDGGTKDSPDLGAGDIVKLQKLFPNNPVWSAPTMGVGNIYLPNVKQARALYRAITKYYAENEVSDDPFPTGNFTGSFLVWSDLVPVFDDLIAFFEETYGFTCSQKVRKTIEEKKRKRREQQEKANQEFRQQVLDFFEGLGTLNSPASSEIRSKLEGKLQEYQSRRESSNYPPSLAIKIDPVYRDAVYKIAVAEAVLNHTSVNLRDLATTRLDEDGEAFDLGIFLNACMVVSVYLGTPLVEGQLRKESTMV